MELKVTLDTSGAAIAGLDHEALKADIQAEVDKFTATASTKGSRRSETAPPPGAQGNVPVIEWIVQIASDPAMAKVYVNALAFALNEILKAVRVKQRPETKSKGKSENDNLDE